LYKVTGNVKENKDGEKVEHEEFYLIATSEQPISGYYAGEWM
jgi:seryl-tRNA synthetase